MINLFEKFINTNRNIKDSMLYAVRHIIEYKATNKRYGYNRGIG